MREGICWRGSDRVRRRQKECSSDQSSVLRSGSQACGRGASVLVGCVVLCLLSWILSRSWTPSPTSAESSVRRGPARAVVLELYGYYRRSLGHNGSPSASVGPVPWRRRGLLEDSEATTSTGQDISSETEQEELQPFVAQSVEDNLSVEFDSLKRRSLLAHDSYIRNSLFVKVGLGYGTHMREYFLNIDTGSAATWVNCVGRGPILFPGPNGIFHPKEESFLNCKNYQEFCKGLQEGKRYSCDEEHKFRCLYEYNYADGMIAQGSIVVGDVSFKLSDGSRKQANLAFGCTEVYTRDGAVQEEVPYDGLLGLGRSLAGWLLQLNMLRIISEYVIAVCLEPEIGHLSPGPGSSVLEHVGFISFGASYTSQAASMAWTATIAPKSTKLEIHDSLYSAWLVGFKYRDEVHFLKSREAMGFDTGSDHTYLTRRIFNLVVGILNEDAIGMGYVQTPDRDDIKEKRNCWQNIIVGRESSVKHFGDLSMMFSSLGDELITSDFVIKPEHCITLGGPPRQRRICFNMHIEHDQGRDEFVYGLLGGEAMRGHLLIFKEQPRQRDLSGLIGWISVTSCRNL